MKVNSALVYLKLKRLQLTVLVRNSFANRDAWSAVCGLVRELTQIRNEFKKSFFGYMDCRGSLFPENLRTRTDVDSGDECRSIFSYIYNDILGIIINFS